MLQLLGVATVPLGAQGAKASDSNGYGVGGYGESEYGNPAETGDDGEEAKLAVETHSSSDVGESSAILAGELTELVGHDSTTVYFEWGPSGEGLPNETSGQTLDSTVTFDDELTDLDDDTEYEFRAVAETDEDTDTGAMRSFTTDTRQIPPSVSTKEETDVGATEVTLNGSLDDLGSTDSADVFFEYRPSGDADWKVSGEQTLYSTGTFTETVDGLSDDTEYLFRAVAETSDGNDVGDELGFTTEEEESDPTPPEIDEFEVTDESNPAWARYEIDWAVSDEDGNLSMLELELTDSSGTVVDSITHSVSGSSASGSDRLRHRNRGTGEYVVSLTVRDATGGTDYDEVSV